MSEAWLRTLERRAAGGDPQGAIALARERIRTGRVGARLAFLHDLLTALGYTASVGAPEWCLWNHDARRFLTVTADPTKIKIRIEEWRGEGYEDEVSVTDLIEAVDQLCTWTAWARGPVAPGFWSRVRGWFTTS